ncbi:MAG: MipA/OmpV family protein [Desulfobacterales bacterium]|jgi:outer membrane protein
MKNQKALMGLTIMLMALFLLIPSGYAANYSIGGGIGVIPDYEGSSDYEFVPLPAGSARFSNGMYIQLMGLNLRANLIPSNMWRLGPVYNYRRERSDVENNRVDSMKNISDANELGIFGGIELNNWFLFLDILGDTGNAYDGWYAILKGGYNWAINNAWMLSMGAHTTYANDDYMSTYFGVSAGDAARSGLSRYNADGGMKDVGIDLGLNWNIASRWDLRGVASISQLIGDADDSSPVVNEGSETQFMGGVMVLFKF